MAGTEPRTMIQPSTLGPGAKNENGTYMMRLPPIETLASSHRTKELGSYGTQSPALELPLKRPHWWSSNSSSIGLQDGNSQLGAVENKDSPLPKRLHPTVENQLPSLLSPFVPRKSIPERGPGRPLWDSYAPATPCSPLWFPNMPGLRPGSPPSQSVHPAPYSNQSRSTVLRPPLCHSSLPPILSAPSRRPFGRAPQLSYLNTHSESKDDESSCKGRCGSIWEGQEPHIFTPNSIDFDSNVGVRNILGQDEEINVSARPSGSHSTCLSPAAAISTPANTDIQSLPQEYPFSYGLLSSAQKAQTGESKTVEKCPPSHCDANSDPSTVAGKTGAEKNGSLENLMTKLLTVLLDTAESGEIHKAVFDPSTQNLGPLARTLSDRLWKFHESHDYVDEESDEESDDDERIEPDPMEDDSDTSSVTLDGPKTPPSTQYPLPGPSSVPLLPDSNPRRPQTPQSDSYQDFDSDDIGTPEQQPDGTSILGERTVAKPPPPEVICIDDSDSEHEASPKTASNIAATQNEVITIDDSDSDILSDVDGSADCDSVCVCCHFEG